MSKFKVIDNDALKNVLQEQVLLSKMSNRFIVNMLCAFQDKDNLYLILQLLTGGDLRYHLSKYIFEFTEIQLKFFLANVLLGLEYIHSENIVHRDIKPENIIFDNKGYAYITDFGIAWIKTDDNTGDNSGTPRYMAPETLFGKEQDFTVDFYSLGVIGYEIIRRKTPYEGYSRKEIRKQMNERTIFLDNNKRNNFSEICADLINKLLVLNPKKRLGTNGINEIKQHEFFKGVYWDLIHQHKYLPPFYDVIKFSRIKNGDVDELFDTHYCNQIENVGQSTYKRYGKIKKDKNYVNYFHDYTIYYVENIYKELLSKRNNKKTLVNNQFRRNNSMGKIPPNYNNNNCLNPNHNSNSINPLILPNINQHKGGNNNKVESNNFKKGRNKRKNSYNNHESYDFAKSDRNGFSINNKVYNNCNCKYNCNCCCKCNALNHRYGHETVCLPKICPRACNCCCCCTPCCKVMETQSDDVDEEIIEIIPLQIPRKPLKVYDTQTIYYTKIIKVPECIPGKRKKTPSESISESEESEPPKPKKDIQASLYCSTCSRKLTTLSDDDELKRIEEEIRKNEIAGNQYQRSGTKRESTRRK